MGGSIGKWVGNVVSAATLGAVDLNKKPKAQQILPQQVAAPAQDEKTDSDVKNKRIKSRQNIFNIAGITGQELKNDQVQQGGGMFSA